MTERELLTKFIDYVYYTDIKSNWYLAIDNFLQQAPPIWTTEYPTKPGFYWVRNCRVLDAEPNVVEVTSRLDVYATGADIEIDKGDIVSAEWCGPIQPPNL